MQRVDLVVVMMRTGSAATRVRAVLLKGQAALLALLFVVSNVGSFVHAATERHARCPEHGELIHIQDASVSGLSDATDAVREAGAAAHGEQLRIGEASPDETGHDHEHCDLCPVSRKRADLSAGLALPMAMAMAAGAPAVQINAQPSGSAVYFIAPKTSPPV